MVDYDSDEVSEMIVDESNASEMVVEKPKLERVPDEDGWSTVTSRRNKSKKSRWKQEQTIIYQSTKILHKTLLIGLTIFFKRLLVENKLKLFWILVYLDQACKWVSRLLN